MSSINFRLLRYKFNKKKLTNALDKEQGGFRRSKNVQDHILTVKEIIEKKH